MVAPSFQSMKQIGAVYIKNGKEYIDVENEKTGTIRSVRWYTDKEYKKQYPDKKKDKDDGFPMLKHARGFDKGPILVIRRDKPEDEPWLCASIARYAEGIRWYIASEDTFPDDAPKHFKYLLLSFKEFKSEDDYHAKKPEELEKILDEKARNGEWFNIDK